MHRICRIAPFCIVLFLCAMQSANAQNDPKGPAMPAAKQSTFGLGSDGGQGQYAMIVPSHRVVIVRRGFDSGPGFRIAKFCADALAAID